MKKIYIPSLGKNPFYFFYQAFFAALVFSIASTCVLAQETPANFTTISWDTVASQPYPVSEAQGKVVNGMLYSFGGFDSQKSTFTPTKRSYLYNPVANTWSAIADLPYTPNGTNYGGVTHAGITTDGTDIYLAGGYTSNTSGTGQIFGTKQAWKYNVSQDSFTVLPDLPISVAAGQLEYLDGKLHYIGGTNLSRTRDLDNHYVLDLNNLPGGWSTLAPLPNPRHHAGSAVYGSKIYFIGGQHDHDEELVTQNDVHFYDPSNNTWTQIAALPVPSGANGRGHISSAVTVMGERILVLGGEIVHNTSVNMVSAYSPANNSWQNLTALPNNRFSGIAGVMNNIIYYTGGSRNNTTYKGTPEVVLSSQDPTTNTSAEDISNLERNFKKPFIYPNPFHKQFKIRFPDSYKGYFSFTIVDQTGKVYNLGKRRVQRDASDIAMDLSNLSLRSGVYFLKINSEIKNEELKLIIQ